jgi:hypothetical protein
MFEIFEARVELDGEVQIEYTTYDPSSSECAAFVAYVAAIASSPRRHVKWASEQAIRQYQQLLADIREYRRRQFQE